MKKILVVFSVVLVFASCTDWLMVQPRGVEIANKVEHYEGLIYGTDLCPINEVFPYMSFENTCDRDGYEMLYAMVGQSACNAYCWRADIFREDEECSEWNFPASFLYNMNIVVNEVMDASDGTQEERLAIQSEARMLRAYMHFLMAQFFGKPYDEATSASDLCIPIITEATTVGADLPRKTVAEVYDFILTEMEEAVEHLQDRAPHHRRVFKTAGYAMLGKVYWTLGRYDEALPALKTAFEAVKEYGTALLDYNELVDNGKMTYPVDDKLNPERLFNIESMFLIWHAMYPSFYGSTLIYLKTDVLSKYFTSTDDLRLSYISGMNSGKSTWRSDFNSIDQYYITLDRMVGNFGMGLPELYLMYAECLARDNQAEEAVALLEELRASRFPAGNSVAVPSESTSGDELVRFCVAERFREHMGYGNNWFDMRRLWNDPLFQDLKEMYVHTVGDETYTLTQDRLVMRIPPQIMAWHPEYIDNE